MKAIEFLQDLGGFGSVSLERASYNGSIEASQASDVGSIPIARSITHDVSTALTRLFLNAGRPRAQYIWDSWQPIEENNKIL
jgi:hypothetical protein